MEFISLDLSTLISSLDKLKTEQKPSWGAMTAQRMVEHLTEMIQMSIGKGDYTQIIAEDKVESMQRFLDSDKPMAKGIVVDLAPADFELKHEELELAIDDFIDNWLSFEEYYEENPNAKHLHPYYGQLNEEKWRKLHSKHFTHHFQQFELISL